MDKEERKLKIPLLIGAFPFLLAGFDGIGRGVYLLGILNLVMSAINLIALRFTKRAPAVIVVAAVVFYRKTKAAPPSRRPAAG